MLDEPKSSSTRPYLIRALHEWCTDNGLTPYIAVAVNDTVQVPREYVQDGQIVLNLGLDATSSLQLGNDYIEFKARFAGTAREIMVPVNQVIAIYARENGQGMAFPLVLPQDDGTVAIRSTKPVCAGTNATGSEAKVVKLASVESNRSKKETNDKPNSPRPSTTGPRPKLKRVK